MVLGKILGGGLPCGALAGRRDLMHALDNRPTGTARTNTISHMGTGNGNPLVAAAGYETLAALADGAALTRADRACAQLRNGLNAFFASEKLAWSAYGETSGFHLFLNPAARAIDPQSFDPCAIAPAELGARNNRLVNDLRVALLAEGVDINAWPGGLTSAAHDAATVDDALGRFARAIAALRKRRDGLTGWADAS
jgi:glutamate-1-semialdehyde 2,1-aminomutase